MYSFICQCLFTDFFFYICCNPNTTEVTKLLGITGEEERISQGRRNRIESYEKQRETRTEGLNGEGMENRQRREYWERQLTLKVVLNPYGKLLQQKRSTLHT